MSRRAPICHPDREYCARGLCKGCYQTAWRRRRMQDYWSQFSARCELCGMKYVPSREEAQLYCTPECQVVANQFARSLKREQENLGPGGEERYATRDPAFARRLVQTALGRGCRKVGRWKTRSGTRGAYVAAWRRPSGLYVVRVRWPEEREEAA